MSDRTVIKLNNIPHGFYEEQMKEYFSQFGKVVNVLLIRSKKTHKSRGFGFVEFELAQIAKTAAEAMHNYLFFNNVLKCRQMNKGDLPKGLFRVKYSGPNNVDKQKIAHNKRARSIESLRKHRKKIERIQRILGDMGIKLSCHIINDLPQPISPRRTRRSIVKVQ